MLVRALSSDCMVERYSVSLKETCGKRKFSVLEAREFIHVRLHKVGRELMDISEVRKLPKSDCLLFVGGRNPFYSKKFDNNSPHTCDFSRELGEKDNSGCDFCISWY